MTEVLTSQERRCLQMWFRQALAKIEASEIAAQLVEHQKEGEPEVVPPSHRTQVARRRSRRIGPLAHKEALV